MRRVQVTQAVGDIPGVLAYVGSPDNFRAKYRASDWAERDNFPTHAAAQAYAQHHARVYPMTPYRIRQRNRPVRFAVEYVPEWNLWTKCPHCGQLVAPKEVRKCPRLKCSPS